MTNPLIHGFYLNFTDGELYTATVSDFSGTDPLIYKEPLRTVQFDSKHLNGTTFHNLHLMKNVFDFAHTLFGSDR